MSTYPPPAGTYQQPQQPSTLHPDTNRSRANSAAAEKYRPRTYSNPPPTQPDPTLLGPHQHPYAPPEPSFYSQQPQHQPPYPPDTVYPNSQAPSPIPMPQPAPSYPSPPHPTSAPGPALRHSSYAQPRPPMDYDGGDDDVRRHSYSSQHSRHSHDSRRSRHSRSSVDGSGGKARKSKHEHPNRTNERPTMGDSLVSVFGLIKSALGPRDK